MKITLNISPCPNDTFMFDAMVNGRIDTRGLEFDLRFADIEQLNNAVLSEDAPQVSKISYAILPELLDRYQLLNSGSALGYGTGPVFVSREPIAQLALARVAIPGEQTTANLLLKKFFPEITDKRAMLFSDIAKSIEAGEVDAGVLIHEGRFTYAARGLHLIADLGSLWETRMAMPLPLGAIVVSRGLPERIIKDIEVVLHDSIRYAMDNPAASRKFIESHAQELDSNVIDSHITTFVNNYSLGLDDKARQGICQLLEFEPNQIFG